MLLRMASGPEILPCIVCRTEGCQRELGSHIARYDCPRCGSFVLTGSAEAVLPDELAKVPLRRSLMSHTIRRMQRPGDRPHKINSNELATFWSERLPTPQQQADNLIRWLGDNQETPYSSLTTPLTVLAATVGMALDKAGDTQGWRWLGTELQSQEFFREKPSSGGKVSLLLTMKGWERYEELKKTHTESRKAFMAMKFRDEVLHRVVEDCFKPAVARAGFELRLLSDEQPAGLIDNQLRAAILSARFLIADLTYGNQGAYWEAGFAEGLNLPVIYTCEDTHWKEYKTHFDTNHMKTIIWDASDLERAGKELTATIRATLRAEAKQTDDT
jgi:nucleoside 2-deoxyribosyltransferase